jgi:hypothetical protein
MKLEFKMKLTPKPLPMDQKAKWVWAEGDLEFEDEGTEEKDFKGHAGRPGMVGGSLPKGGSADSGAIPGDEPMGKLPAHIANDKIKIPNYTVPFVSKYYTLETKPASSTPSFIPTEAQAANYTDFGSHADIDALNDYKTQARAGTEAMLLDKYPPRPSMDKQLVADSMTNAMSAWTHEPGMCSSMSMRLRNNAEGMRSAADTTTAINKLSRYLDDVTLTSDLVTYRGLAPSDYTTRVSNLPVGGRFKDRSFSSTALDEDTARQFANTGTSEARTGGSVAHAIAADIKSGVRNNANVPVIMKVLMPKGTHASVAFRSWYHQENEVIVQRNTSYVVINKKLKTDKNGLQYMEMIVGIDQSAGFPPVEG